METKLTKGNHAKNSSINKTLIVTTRAIKSIQTKPRGNQKINQ